MTAIEIINDNVREVLSTGNVHYAYAVIGMNVMALKLHAITAREYMEFRKTLLYFIEKKKGEEHENV
jgi:hypothetical protein